MPRVLESAFVKADEKEPTVTVATAPPVVVKTAPVAGSDDVDPSLSEIKVTFSKFGRNRRLVLILEWLTLWPTSAVLPVRSQRRDIRNPGFLTRICVAKTADV